MGTSELNQEKSTTEDDPFLMLSDTQWRFVTAMIDNPKFNKADAARHVKLKPNTVYGWGDIVDRAVAMARKDMHSAALTVRKNALLKAMQVKLKLLDHKDGRIRDKAATDILEWELGRATQPLGGTGKDGAIPVELTWKAVVEDALTDAGSDDDNA